jgi:YD repeat-containing protein
MRQSRAEHVPTFSVTYDAQDRLKSFGSNTYSYSKNGDLTSATDSSSADTTSYDYNSLGDLKQIAIPDGKQIRYLTDPLGRRIGKKVDGQLVQGFVYGDDLGPEAEVNLSGYMRKRSARLFLAAAVAAAARTA